MYLATLISACGTEADPTCLAGTQVAATSVPLTGLHTALVE